GLVHAIRSRTCDTVSEMGQTKPHVSWEACSALSPWWRVVGGTIWCPFAPKVGCLLIRANFWLTITIVNHAQEVNTGCAAWQRHSQARTLPAAERCLQVLGHC